MLVAKTAQENLINVAINRNDANLRKLRKEERFFCPECEEEVILKIGTKRITHFAHKKGSACLESYERESEYHLQGKLQLYYWLLSHGVNPKLEQYEQSISQRPDISFFYNGRKYVIEYQCSPIPTDVFMKRTCTYLKENMIPIWIIGGKNIIRKGNSVASLSSFEYLFLRKTASDQWFLQAYCPTTNHLITMRNITPISIKNVLTDFSVVKLPYAKLTDLLHPREYNASTLTSWRSEIRKWKNRVALYGTPKNKFLLELYSNALIPCFLPPAIGLPVVHLPLIETPPVQWQSYIYLDLLKQEQSISLGKILHLFHTRIRKQEVSIRNFPLSQESDYQNTIKEYINLLVSLNIVQKVNENSYKLHSPLCIAKNQMEQDKMEQNFYEKYSKIILDGLRNQEILGDKNGVSLING